MGARPLAAATDATLKPNRQSLDAIFSPRSVAVIGATETTGSVGRTVLWNLTQTPFGGAVYPVNPKRATVLGIRAYKAIQDLPEPVDLAVIVTPAASVPALVGECVDAGVRAAIIISAGFKELGPAGMELERQVLAQADRSGMRLIGPNCLGVMNPLTGLNATFAKGIARPGSIAFISQSGALLTGILDWSLREHVGFSSFVSTGSMLDVSWGDLIDYFGNDPKTNAILIYMESIGEPTQTSELLRQYTLPARSLGKPILASWMGGADVAAGEEILNRAGIPTFTFPDTAARMFTYLWRYSYNLRGLYETPAASPDGDAHAPDQQAAQRLIATARDQGRTLLTEYESKSLLATYGIPSVPTRVAETAAEAMKIADSFGYPVVLKLHSSTVTHKTDVGGVALDLPDRRAVEAAFNAIRASVHRAAGDAAFNGVTVQPMISLNGAYELILGSSIDPDFGPVLLFGTGGQLVEVYKDRSLALPPLNATLARRMMEQTKIYTALRGVRGRKSVDTARLEQLLVRFSQLVVEQRWIKEIDINPLLASPDGLLALDARVVLHSPETSEADLPRLAIRPYPSQYVRPWTTREGVPVIIRPIRPEDEPLLIRFHQTLSAESVQQRYFGTISLEQRTGHDRLTRVCFNDYTRELALVVEHADKSTNELQILGIGRLSRLRATNDAELAFLVSDTMQHQGIGTELASCLVAAARAEKISNLRAWTSRENRGMQRILQKSGFTLKDSLDGPTITACMALED